jgi:1-deoxy-D-xylulose-5-phosphate reductoisomerase
MSFEKRKVVILGSTGSIGTQALEITRQYSDLFEIVALSANQNEAQISRQAKEFHVESAKVVLATRDGDEAVANLAKGLDKNNCSFDFDVVLNAITGSIGLQSTLNAVQSNKCLALANKESLVAGGSLVRENTGLEMWKKIIPVDSEHSAIWQSFFSGNKKSVRKLILTASGGPFRDVQNLSELRSVTPEQALNHPVWQMGKVVSINSSTLMNKALELIEAAYLFNIDPDQIEVVVHRESIIHSMVEYCDGSTIAQLSTPNMKLPIALGMASQSSDLIERLPNAVQPLDWQSLSKLSFNSVDNQLFPFIELARTCFKRGPLYPAVKNALNEEAVNAFISGQIIYLDISKHVQRTINSFDPKEFSQTPQSPSFEEIQMAEHWARQLPVAAVR